MEHKKSGTEVSVTLVPPVAMHPHGKVEAGCWRPRNPGNYGNKLLKGLVNLNIMTFLCPLFLGKINNLSTKQKNYPTIKRLGCWCWSRSQKVVSTARGEHFS